VTERAYSIQYPDGADVDDLNWGEIEAKGFLPVSSVSGEDTYAPVFYDPVRLQQDATVVDGERFALPGLVVLTRVTRQNVERAIEELSRTGFSELSAW
jgi:hypothetical protein